MSQPDSNAPNSKPRWTGVSVALFVIGLLILVPSGLCTGLFLLSMLAGVAGFAGQDLGPLGAVGAFLNAFYVVLLFGGVPMLLGAALVYSGLKARRRN